MGLDNIDHQLKRSQNLEKCNSKKPMNIDKITGEQISTKKKVKELICPVCDKKFEVREKDNHTRTCSDLNCRRKYKRNYKSSKSKFEIINGDIKDIYIRIHKKCQNYFKEMRGCTFRMYWNIGKIIIEELGEGRQPWGKKVIQSLSNELDTSKTNLYNAIRLAKNYNQKGLEEELIQKNISWRRFCNNNLLDEDFSTPLENDEKLLHKNKYDSVENYKRTIEKEAKKRIKVLNKLKNEDVKKVFAENPHVSPNVAQKVDRIEDPQKRHEGLEKIKRNCDVEDSNERLKIEDKMDEMEELDSQIKYSKKIRNFLLRKS